MKDWKILVLALRELATEKGISINQIAEQTNRKQSAISLFFARKNPPTLANFLDVCEVLGTDITLTGVSDDVIKLATLIQKRNDKIENILD